MVRVSINDFVYFVDRLFDGRRRRWRFYFRALEFFFKVLCEFMALGSAGRGTSRSGPQRVSVSHICITVASLQWLRFHFYLLQWRLSIQVRILSLWLCSCYNSVIIIVDYYVPLLVIIIPQPLTSHKNYVLV